MPKAPFRGFLNLVFKRKTQILLFFGAVVCIFTIGTLLVRPTYEAISQVLVKIGRENLYVANLPSSVSPSPVINFNGEEQINAEIEILRGLSLAEEVVKSLGPTVIYKGLNDKRGGILSGLFPITRAQKSPVREAMLRFQKVLKVEGVRKANVIKVSFKHHDPQVAATVVNSLVKLYLDRHLQVHKNPQSYKFFEEQSKILENKLRDAEGKLQAYKRQHDLTSLEEERSLLLEQAALLHAVFNMTASQEVKTENRIRKLRQQLVSTPKTILQGEEIDHNPFLISNLQTRLVELELREKELITKRTEQSRLVQNVRNEINMVREKLAEQEVKRYGKSRYGLSETYQRLEDELLRNEAELKALQGEKEVQSAQLDEYQGKLKKLNQVEVRFRELQQRVEIDRQNYQLYLTKFEESRISDAMDTEKIANISVIEPARPPFKPVSPNIKLNIVLGILLGGFGGLGLAFFLEHLNDSLERPEDVEEVLQVPVLASLPKLKN